MSIFFFGAPKISVNAALRQLQHIITNLQGRLARHGSQSSVSSWRLVTLRPCNPNPINSLLTCFVSLNFELPLLSWEEFAPVLTRRSHTVAACLSSASM